VQNTGELFPHGGNGCVDVVCCGTVCRASDNGVYVARGLALLDAIRTWGRVRDGRCRKKRAFAAQPGGPHLIRELGSTIRLISFVSFKLYL